MKKVMNRGFKASRWTGFRFALAISVLLTVVGCADGDEVGDGYILNNMVLPQDNELSLYCPDVGLVAEFCILDDPANPYARAAINDETKWDLASSSPSAKSDFYLWGTAQARSPRGENQYYTAVSLHKVYTRGSTEAVRNQVRRAYRSVLDNYFGSITFFQIGEVLLPQDLKDLAAENIYNPASSRLLPLFDSQADALANLNQWGYLYDVNTGIVTKM